MTHEELEAFTYEELEAYTYEKLELITAVFDRTLADVEAKNEKGTNSLLMWNRVEANCKTIGDIIAIPTTTKSWVMTNTPKVSDYLRVRNNVEAIRSGYGTFPNTPTTPTQPLNDYKKWNAIEKILYDVNKLYDDTQNALYYSGDELYSGESVGIL